MSSRVILVTGANRGIGFAILQALATRSPLDHYLLGSRTLGKGTAAVTQLREKGISSAIDVVEIDVTQDSSIVAAEKEIREKYGRLDILINNAGIGLIPSATDYSDLRAIFNNVYNTNVSSVALAMSIFLPLLKSSSPDPRIINISSARGSMGLSAAGKMPPTVSVPYSISKTALNATTLEYSRIKENEGVIFQCASPGHCRTEFNGFRGTKDPLDGAKVVVKLAFGERHRYQTGLNWQMEGEDVEPMAVAW